MFYILLNFTFKQEMLDGFNGIDSQTTGLVGTYFVVPIHFREAKLTKVKENSFIHHVWCAFSALKSTCKTQERLKKKKKTTLFQ